MPLPRKMFLLACAVLFLAPTAFAADLAVRQSRIGAIFAEPPARVARVEVVRRPQAAFVGAALRVPGYYGRPTDFEYRNYYGASATAIYSRLPYACGFVGLC